MAGRKVQNLLGPAVGLSLTLPASHSVQARPLDWQPGGGGIQGIEAVERNGRAYCPKPARGPQRPAGLFISAPKQTGHFPGLGVGGL